jgi:SAM-dependent methyltransferase
MTAGRSSPHPAEREPQRIHQQLQAEVWENEAETLLDRIGVEPGWRCVDLGSGAFGILASLARRVGARGLVVGTEIDAAAAREALAAAREAGHGHLQMVLDRLLEPAFADASFDLVHLRFALHLVDPAAATRRMVALARPGGVVAVQETDLQSWRYEPEVPAWASLLETLRRAIALGGDPDVGNAVPRLLVEAGLEAVEVRSVALRLGDRHPHMRLPLAWAAAQRRAILAHALADEADLDDWLAGLEARLEDPHLAMVTPTTVQAWGRRPRGSRSRDETRRPAP